MPVGASKAKREEYENLKPGDENTKGPDRREYLEANGCAGWPAMMTRPECAFFQSRNGSFQMYPTWESYGAVMHVIGYLINKATSMKGFLQ